MDFETYDQRHRREFPDQYIWENYNYPDMGISHDELVCRIPVFIFNARDCRLTIKNTKLTENNKKTIDYIIQNQKLLIDDIRLSVFKYYEFIWNDWIQEDYDEQEFPNPNSNDITIIDNLVKLTAIYVGGKDEGYFGLCFSCTFDLEHGLGVRIRNYKVEDVGGQDTGFSLYDTIE